MKSDFPFRADLHCHSTCSDGTDSPEALIELAIEKGLQGLSITDHDTISAYKTALPIAQKKNFLLLPGCEISSTFKGESIHILAYAFPLEGEIRALCEMQKQKREERNKNILRKLKNLGIEIDVEGESRGRPHIANEMIKKGLVKSIREAFDKYLGEGKIAYDPGVRLEVPQALQEIKKAKGLAILAHPHLISRKRILKALLDMPFDGIECYYAKMFLHQEEPFIKIGKKKGWIMTGGSDYHGAIKPQSELGSSWVDLETFQTLYAHYTANTL